MLLALVRPVAAHAKCFAGRQAGSEDFDHCLQIELGALLDRAHGAHQLHIHTTMQRKVVLRSWHLLETQLHGLYTASVDPCRSALSANDGCAHPRWIVSDWQHGVPQTLPWQFLSWRPIVWSSEALLGDQRYMVKIAGSSITQASCIGRRWGRAPVYSRLAKGLLDSLTT